MKYDFSKSKNRLGTSSLKWDLLEELGGSSDSIPMWVADMDFTSPIEVENALLDRVRRGVYGYTVRMNSFDEALVNYYKRHHNWEIEPSWLVQAECGLVNAIKNIVEEFTEPNEAVIVQSPVYHGFYRPLQNLNRRIISNPLILENGQYRMDIEGLKSLITPGVKLLLLCNPHNPTGRVWSSDELGELCSALDGHNIQLFSDEIHMDLTYGEKQHTPIMHIKHPVAQNAIVGISATKTFNIAGFYMGSLVIKSPQIRERMQKRFSVNEDNATNVFGVVACEAAYKYGDDWKNQLMEYLESNVTFVRDFLAKNVPQIRLIEPEATYLLWLDCRDLGLDDSALKSLFYEKIKVMPSMGTDFGLGGEGFVRMNIACPREVLSEALNRIANTVCRKL